MKLLVIDPGLTATGAVLVENGEKILISQTTRTRPNKCITSRLRKITDEIEKSFMSSEPDLIVVEYPLFPAKVINWKSIGVLWQAVGCVLWSVRGMFPNSKILLVVPSRGKARPKTKSPVKGLTQHEADAYYLAQYVEAAYRITAKALQTKCPNWHEGIIRYSRGTPEVLGAWEF